VARSYGRLAAATASIGRKPRGRVMDVLIAATAHAHGARLTPVALQTCAASRIWWRSSRV